MASIVAMAVGMPMAMGGVPATASVNDVAATYDCSATAITLQPNPTTDTDGTVSFELMVNDDNGADTIPDEGWTAEVNFGAGLQTVPLSCANHNTTADKFTNTTTVPHDTEGADPSKAYLVIFKNSTGAEVCQQNVYVTGVPALEIDFNAIAYGAIVPGDSSTISGNATMEPLGEANTTGLVKPTVMNDGNLPNMDVNMTIAQTSGPDALFEGNTTATVDVSGPKTLSTSVAHFNVNIGIGGKAKIDSTLAPLKATKAGNYEATLTIGPEYVA